MGNVLEKRKIYASADVIYARDHRGGIRVALPSAFIGNIKKSRCASVRRDFFIVISRIPKYNGLRHSEKTVKLLTFFVLYGNIVANTTVAYATKGDKNAKYFKEYKRNIAVCHGL